MSTENTMAQRVSLNEETYDMSVPEKSERGKEQDKGEHEDSSDNEKKEESLPALGRLSLNVKAVPYIPKQDGTILKAKGINNTQEKFDVDQNDEAGSREQDDTMMTTSEKFSEEQRGNETEEELQQQIILLKQNLKHYEEIIDQYQASEQNRKREVDSALISAREVVERERREKMDVLSDRKSRQEQFDQLSKTLSILQAENEELQKMKRQQDEKLAELARLKTLIQENGFPNIEQFLMLQQQIETFRDDFFTERKERERLQSQKEKMKRDLDAAQSRIASLQEQVYKYREHIYFIQSKFKQSSPFRPLPFYESGNNRSTNAASEACKLYGPNATQYINHGLTSSISPVGGAPAGGDPKFPSRGDKKSFSGRQWQDGRMSRPPSGSEEWRRAQQATRNGYFNNSMNRMTSSNSAPSLAAMVTGEQSSDTVFYDKQYTKSGFPRRPRSFLTDDTSKDFGMPNSDWSKQAQSKQGKRFSSPLASPNLLSSPAAEVWSPQQPPAFGLQKGWHSNQEEIFRFPSSPLSTTSKSFDTWPNSSSLATDDQNVFAPPTSCANEEGNFFPLTMPSGGRTEGNFGRFSQGHMSTNGKVYVCYNCGINFEDNDAHRSHVEKCGI